MFNMMKNTTTIRTATKKDLATIVTFQICLARESEHLELEQNILSKGVLYILENPIRGEYYLAEVGNEIVACLLILPEWSDWRNKEVLWIHSVYVKKEWRKQGVFRSMYEYLAKKVNTEKNYAGLRLFVDKRNTPAQKVYKSIGMNDEHYSLFEWLSV
jgi:GNAT superfamily N-acetyltransferase